MTRMSNERSIKSHRCARIIFSTEANIQCNILLQIQYIQMSVARQITNVYELTRALLNDGHISAVYK